MIIVLMGVAGCGKTSVGKLLSESLGWRYFDADDFHPPANINKMANGIPLNDADRQPWLESLQRLITDNLDNHQSAVVACSALKQSYRNMLLVDERVLLVYLKGSYDLIAERLSARGEHYMNPDLLDSQFEALEEPLDALHVDIASSPDRIVETIREKLGV
jgi:gluconokinase